MCMLFSFLLFFFLLLFLHAPVKCNVKGIKSCVTQPSLLTHGIYCVIIRCCIMLYLVSIKLILSYGVSNHQPHDCLLNRLFTRRSKKTSKLCVTGLCEGNSPMTGEFPTQWASNAENVSIWWRLHVYWISYCSQGSFYSIAPWLFEFLEYVPPLIWSNDIEWFSAMLSICYGNPLTTYMYGFPLQRTSNEEL